MSRPNEPIQPESDSSASPDETVAIENQPKRKLIVLLMLAAGCVFTYFSLPDGNQVIPSPSRSVQKELPLKDQYSRYMKELEAARKAGSTDSLKDTNDSIKPKH